MLVVVVLVILEIAAGIVGFVYRDNIVSITTTLVMYMYMCSTSYVSMVPVVHTLYVYVCVHNTLYMHVHVYGRVHCCRGDMEKR